MWDDTPVTHTQQHAFQFVVPRGCYTPKRQNQAYYAHSQTNTRICLSNAGRMPVNYMHTCHVRGIPAEGLRYASCRGMIVGRSRVVLLAPRATIVTGQHHQPLRGNETRHALVQADVGDYGKFKFNTVFVIGRYADQIRSSLQHSGCGQSRRMSRYRAQEVRDMVSEPQT